jgi:hypothetical protein
MLGASTFLAGANRYVLPKRTPLNLRVPDPLVLQGPGLDAALSSTTAKQIHISFRPVSTSSVPVLHERTAVLPTRA